MEKKWKYRLDEERLINKSEVEILISLIRCPICLNIIWNPKSCQSCQNKFCDTCISDYCQDQYTSSPRCPFRCIFVKSKADILLIQLLNLIKFSCIFKKDGCSETLTYEHISKHESECEFRKQLCIGCSLNFNYRDYIDHLQDCDLKNLNKILSKHHKFSNELKSNKILIDDGDKFLYLPFFDSKFHVAFGDKSMSSGVHKWKLFFDSFNETGVGMVAGIAEINEIPEKYTFERYVDIYQDYLCYACTIWNQHWAHSINDTSKSFQDNRWDRKWWNYCLDFDKKLFTVSPPNGEKIEFSIKIGGSYRIYIEVGYPGNSFILDDDL